MTIFLHPLLFFLLHNPPVMKTMYLLAAPTAGPSVVEEVKEDGVSVSWTEIPRAQRRGCITSYTIYLQSDSEEPQTCES